MADNNQFVQGKPSYSLVGNGVSSSDTSVTVSDFTLPDGTNITMSMFGDTGYGTFEPGTAREENVSFTGVTQNANGTATLTGVTRGLRFVAPYTADSGLAKGHGGNTPFVLSNSAPFYNELSGKDNDETITGTWTFTNPAYPRMNQAVNPPVDDEQLATKKYVDDTAGGSPVSINRIVVSGTAGATISAGDLVYLDTTDTEWKLVDATNIATLYNVELGIAQGAGIDGNAIVGGVLIQGLDSNQTGLSVNNLAYATDVAGTIGTSAGTNEKIIGYVVSATQVVLSPEFGTSPTADEKDALVGTSGSPSTTNLYVTDDDTATTGTANKVVRGDANGLIDESWVPTDNQIFTVDGTWTKPNNISFVEVVCIGAGGGGGGGSVKASTTGGGAGAGGGGAVTRAVFSAASLPSSVSVTVGVGGSGGAGASTAGNGSNGGDGTSSSFGDWLIAGGGGGGRGGNGSNNAVAGGGGGGALTSASGPTGGTPTISGANAISLQGPTATNSATYNAEYGGATGGFGRNTNSDGEDGGSSIFGAPGGGGGAAESSFGAFTGGDGGTTLSYTAGGGASGGAGATGASAGTAGDNGLDNATLGRGYTGSGGGGGGNAENGVAGDGGNGGNPGAGAGGGGASETGTGGNGGDGGRGEVRVYSW